MATLVDVKNKFYSIVDSWKEDCKSSVKVNEYSNAIEFVSERKDLIKFLWVKLALLAGSEFDTSFGKVMGSNEYYFSMSFKSNNERQLGWINAQLAK